MGRMMKLGAVLFSFVLILAVGGCFAAVAGPNNPVKNSAATKADTTKTTAANSATSGTANQTKTGSMNKASAKNPKDVLAAAEQLNGTISFIGSSDREVTLTGADGTPYDFCVTPRTKIDFSGKKIGTSQLPNEEHKQASVQFVPTAKGNMAQHVNIS
jgi:hypothetical protein